jgi:hypothetical protein
MLNISLPVGVVSRVSFSNVRCWHLGDIEAVPLNVALGFFADVPKVLNSTEDAHLKVWAPSRTLSIFETDDHSATASCFQRESAARF